MGYIKRGIVSNGTHDENAFGLVYDANGVEIPYVRFANLDTGEVVCADIHAPPPVDFPNSDGVMPFIEITCKAPLLFKPYSKE